MKDITKEQAKGLFQGLALLRKENNSILESVGTIGQPVYSIKINEVVNISLLKIVDKQTSTLSTTSYSLKIVFGDFIEYKSFELDEKEFTCLASDFEAGETFVFAKNKKEIISQGELILEESLANLSA